MPESGRGRRLQAAGCRLQVDAGIAHGWGHPMSPVDEEGGTVSVHEQSSSPCRRTALLQLSAIHDFDRLPGRSIAGTLGLDGFDDIESVSHAPEHHMLAIQPWGTDGRDEEL